MAGIKINPTVGDPKHLLDAIKSQQGTAMKEFAAMITKDGNEVLRKRLVEAKDPNEFKDQLKRSKVYEHLTNQKRDIKNKIVSALTNNYQTIVFQDESIKAWHSGGHGKKIQNTALGGIIRDLKDKSHTPIVVDKFFPSTQLCPCCSHKYKLSLSERTYICPVCSYTADRDVKAAQCILTEGLQKQTQLPTERRNVKPEETLASVGTLFNSLKRIKNVSVSKVKTLSLESKSQEAHMF